MAITTPPTVTAPPDVPTRASPVTFAARGDSLLSWLPTAWTNLSASMTWIYATAVEVFASANAAQADRITCATAAAAVTATNPVANAAAAAASAASAAAYASAAQATNPDSPIRTNPRFITANFTVASAYNAQSTGPITVSDGVTVTIADNATYAIQ